jgi:hypothetical protein
MIIYPNLFTNFVAIESLCEASLSASLATLSSTPDISYRTRPGFTTATHASGDPFPFPILVSAGFFVSGLSGKIRIQTLQPLLTCLVIAILAASIAIGLSVHIAFHRFPEFNLLGH